MVCNTAGPPPTPVLVTVILVGLSVEETLMSGVMARKLSRPGPLARTKSASIRWPPYVSRKLKSRPTSRITKRTLPLSRIQSPIRPIESGPPISSEADVICRADAPCAVGLIGTHVNLRLSLSATNVASVAIPWIPKVAFFPFFRGTTKGCS